VANKGPARLPEDVRARRGTLQRCRTNPDRPKVEPGVPEAPAFLGAFAAAEWRRIVPLLDDAGLLTPIDRAALAAYCVAWGQLAEAETALQGLPPTVTDEHGLEVVNPAVEPFQKKSLDAIGAFYRYAREFGMSPSARASVKAGPSAKDRAAADRRKRFAILGAGKGKPS